MRYYNSSYWYKPEYFVRRCLSFAANVRRVEFMVTSHHLVVRHNIHLHQNLHQANSSIFGFGNIEVPSELFEFLEL